MIGSIPISISFVSCYDNAGVAQLVEQLPCKQQAGGSSPFASSINLYNFSVFDQFLLIFKLG